MLKPALILAAAAAALTAPAAAQSGKGARQQAIVIMPDDPKTRDFQTSSGFADAIVTGDTIYLSGVVATAAPGDQGLSPAFDRAFARIGAILKRAGASWDDVVDITTFHTDLAGQAEQFSAVKHRYVKAPFPAWTAIGISTLHGEGAVAEIKVVARMRAQ